MKKSRYKLILVTLLAIIFISCDKDESENSIDKPACRIESLVYDDFDGDAAVNWLLSYEDDLLTGMDGYIMNERVAERRFYYDSQDRIVKIEYRDDDFVQFCYTQEFGYIGNQITIQSKNVCTGSYYDKLLLELDGNNNMDRFSYYYNNEGEYILDFYYLYTWQNDNLIKGERWELSSSNYKSLIILNKTFQNLFSMNSIKEQTRFLKNTRFKNEYVKDGTYNIEYRDGFNPFFYIFKNTGLPGGDVDLYMSFNLPTNYKLKDTEGVVLYEESYSYELNEHLFPTRIQSFENGSLVTQIDIVYNCN